MCTHVAARKGRSLASAVYTQLHLTRRLRISLDSSDEWWNLWAPSTRGRLQELEESCGHDRPIGPPGLRMKSGTTGSVSSRSDHSAASSHSTPPPATMVHYHHVGEHELLLCLGKWNVFSDAINRKKISRIRFWTRTEETGLSVCSCSASRSGRSSDRTCENVYL